MNGQTLTTDQINEALFFIQDKLDRAQIPFILLKDLAKRAHDQNTTFKGKMDNVASVDLGVMKRHFTQDTFPLFKTVMDTYHKEPIDYGDTAIRTTYKDVPIYIKIIKSNFKFFQNPSTVFYEVYEFQVANPFEDYWRARFIIK